MIQEFNVKNFYSLINPNILNFNLSFTLKWCLFNKKAGDMGSINNPLALPQVLIYLLNICYALFLMNFFYPFLIFLYIKGFAFLRKENKANLTLKIIWISPSNNLVNLTKENLLHMNQQFIAANLGSLSWTELKHLFKNGILILNFWRKL